MPNLVGIGNSQVPTNAMLGGLAYQDPAHANLTEVEIENIAAIKAKTADTAVDVFVYDTRKDSDGGAWRKRTSHTSWYNEGVSKQRGARKEFPAVAVIVAYNNGLIIYDGDDPNLPMWMEIWQYVNNSSGNTNWWGGSGNCTAVAAMNGTVTMVGVSNGARNLHFINDRMSLFYTSASGNFTQLGGISNRNVAYTAWTPSDEYYAQLNNSAANDVAITVLPNAPIDASTGLPIPTFAVATDAGVSVIKDDRTVVDINRTNDDDVHHIAFDDDRVIMVMELGAIYVATIPSADQSGNPNAAWSVYGTYSANTSGTNYPAIFGYGAGGNVVSMKDNTFASAGYNGSTAVVQEDYKGLSILSQNISSSGNGMVAWIKSNFNTGWMHGDIKGAFLSDTDTSNLVDTNLVSNGTFDSNTSGWSTSNATMSHDSGRLKMVSSSGNQNVYTTITCVVGKKYYFQADFQGQVSFHLSTGTSSANDVAYIPHANYGSSTTKFCFFTATQTTHYVVPYVIGTNNTGYVDNVIVKLADHDRSINGGHERAFSGINGLSSGLQVYGTINRTPVATGAELVAYSNFSNSRYLLQPYNSDLDFTTTMSIMFWVKDWVGSDSLLHRGPGTTRNSKTSFHLYCSYDYNYRITFTTNGSSEQSFEFNHSANLEGWQHVCFTLSGGTVRGFLNGVERTMSSTSFSGSIFGQGTDKNGLYVGTGPVGGPADTASLALLRLSATVPSAEQVKKIYDDEKHLFQENAKCTLYGSSNAVTAVAYDDSNYTLHAGTSSGRSEFSGLNRINNTTTAVTTAISTSDGLVAEQ